MNPEEILSQAKKRFSQAVTHETQLRKDMLEDLKFSKGEQWPDTIRQEREIDRRPCLTINRLPQFIRQITNEQRANRPGIKITPSDNLASVEVAKIRQGMIRHIEYKSNADTAYDTAIQQSSTIGLGYIRVTTEYESPESFDQEIKIKRIINPFSVYLDPDHTEVDGCDVDWCIISTHMAREEFKAEYPDSKLSELLTHSFEFSGFGDSEPSWFGDDDIRVVEYFVKEYTTRTLILLNNKKTCFLEQLDKLPKGVFEVARRNTQTFKIKWYKLNGVEILDETEWLGKYIPIIPVIGDETFLDGKRDLSGVVRHAKDSQRMYNFWASAETEMIALAPKASYIGAEGSFSGYEKMWASSSTRNYPFLEYKVTNFNGQLNPPPTRSVYEPPIQAITVARREAADDLKATTGIYDAALGAQGVEQSGKAISARKSQSQISNFHYIDNYHKALRHVGRIIDDLIPHIYSDERVVGIVGDDGTRSTTRVNDQTPTPNDLTKGQYDCIIDTGPSYQTKRQESSESMMQFVQAVPQAMQVAGDLIAKAQDWPGAEQISERLKSLLPPQLQNQEQNTAIPPQVQAQIQQSQQMIQQLTEQLNQAIHKLETKQVEIESNERVSFAKMQVDLLKTEMMMGSQEAQLAFREELAHIRSRLGILNINHPLDHPDANPPMSNQPPTPSTPSQ